jgi:peptidyl-prolyl cis-trans isomerase C
MELCEPVLDEAQPSGKTHELHKYHASKWLRWLREPLVHFLLIGSLLFIVYGYTNRGQGNATSNKIELTPTDINRLQMYFASQWHRQPTPQELSILVEDWVRDEVLYREALSMNLDKDDTIVKRRMAQKMEFLSEDVANAHEPSTEELKTWYGKNEQRFALPSQVTFRQLYFSSDRRGIRTRDDATSALSQLAGQSQGSKDAASLADHFMLPDYYEDRSLNDLTKDFGLQFAQSIFKVKPGSWEGPIQSGYGWHLVFVKSVIQGRTPAFEEVEPDVKAAWFAEQHTEEWRKSYATMRAKYQVALPANISGDPSRIAISPPGKPVSPPSEGSQ